MNDISEDAHSTHCKCSRNAWELRLTLAISSQPAIGHLTNNLDTTGQSVCVCLCATGQTYCVRLQQPVQAQPLTAASE